MTSVLKKLKQIFGIEKRHHYYAKLVDAHPKPDEIELGKIYIVNHLGHHKWAYLRCPCPKHDVIRLNLNKSQRPSWTISISKGNIPNVVPSIWQLDGCYSHFNIRSGNVIWAKGSGYPR